MSLSIQVQISDELTSLFQRLSALDLDDAVQATALDSEAFAKRGFRDTPRTGRQYRRGKRYHTASAAGDFPAIDTGELSRSTHTEKTGSARYRIVFGKEYSIYLEYGTRTMGARPFVKPTTDYAEKRLNERARTALRRAGL